MKRRIRIASWLFLIESGLFLAEAIFEALSHFLFTTLLHLSEGALFLIGSVFFMPESTSSSRQEMQ